MGYLQSPRPVENEESTILLYRKGFGLVEHLNGPFARQEWEVPSRWCHDGAVSRGATPASYSAFFTFLLRVPSLSSSFDFRGEAGATAGAWWWWSSSDPPTGEPKNRKQTQDSMREKGEPWEWRAVITTWGKTMPVRGKKTAIHQHKSWEDVSLFLCGCSEQDHLTRNHPLVLGAVPLDLLTSQ